MEELHQVLTELLCFLANEKNIREVTMFPMNQNAQDLMMNAPSAVSDEQLKELNLKLKRKVNYFFPLRSILISDKSTNFFIITSNKAFTSNIFY